MRGLIAMSKYQIWTNGNRYKIRLRNRFGFWNAITIQKRGPKKVVYFNTIEQAREYTNKLEQQKEENNPRWRMIEEI